MGSTFFSKRYNPGTARNRKTRPKTFSSEADAKKYAEAHKIAKYKVVPVQYKVKPKFKLVLE